MLQLKDDKEKNPNLRRHLLQIRINDQEHGVLKQKAALYSEGNVSRWVRAAFLKYKPLKDDTEQTE